MNTKRVTNLFLIIIGGGLLAACQHSSSPQAASQESTVRRSAEKPIGPKYLDGQKVLLGNRNVRLGLHNCLPNAPCKYLVYFLDDTAKAVEQRREVENKWVNESELGPIMPSFDVGEKVKLLA